MSGAAIVIEIAATDAGSPYAAALVEACTRGSHADAPCALTGSADASPPPMVAVVTWQDGEHRAVEVQVGAHREGGNEWSNRHLNFAETDAEVERWRAVGLVIATLAGEVSAAAAQPAKPVPPPAPAPPPAPSPASAPAQPAPWQVPAWTVQADAELSRGSSSLGAHGASLRVTRRLSPRFLYATASAHYDLESVRQAQLDLSWTTLTLGALATLPIAGPRLALEARLEPALTFVRADLVNRATGTNAQSGSLWSLREGLGAVWWWSEWFGINAAADLSESNRRTVVRSQQGTAASHVAAEVGPLGWSATLGVRVGFGAQ